VFRSLGIPKGLLFALFLTGQLRSSRVELPKMKSILRAAHNCEWVCKAHTGEMRSKSVSSASKSSMTVLMATDRNPFFSFAECCPSGTSRRCFSFSRISFSSTWPRAAASTGDSYVMIGLMESSGESSEWILC
jgi:hypothetical protein